MVYVVVVDGVEESRFDDLDLARTRAGEWSSVKIPATVIEVDD